MMQIGADSLSANIDTAAVTRAACEGQISALVLRPFPLELTRRVIQETGNMMVSTWANRRSTHCKPALLFRQRIELLPEQE